MPRHRKFAVALAVASTLAVAGCTSTPPRPAATGRPTSTASAPSLITGHTVVELTAVTSGNVAPTQQQLDSSAGVLVKRFVAAGFPAPAVTGTPSHGLRLDITAPITSDQVYALVAPSVLAFRTVLGTTAARPAPGAVPTQSGLPAGDASVLAEVRRELGAAYTLADQLTQPPDDQPTIGRLAPFGHLSPAEVVLPAEMQFDVPTIGCAQLDARNPLYVTDARHLDQHVTACDPAHPDTKYLLDVAAVGNADIAGAEAKNDPVTYGATGGWYVEIDFTPSGQRKWTNLTTTDLNQQVGIVFDASVLSAPTIADAIAGPAVVSGGGIDEAFARRMANVIGAGTLAVEFSVTLLAR